MDRPLDSNKPRELTTDELSAVGGGSAAWGGVGAALGFSLGGPVGAVVGFIVVAYFRISSNKSLTRIRNYTASCVPTSTTRPVGIWKKSVASLALRASPINSRSCQRGMLDFAAGRSARRDRKNDVDMISKFQPFFRASPSAFGTFGIST